jgi:predicted  nucleic acid-binding Zn-ribbon protein
MTTSKLLYTSIFGAFLLAGCNDTSTKLTQAEQKELSDLRGEKTAWDLERMQLQDSLELMENAKNEAISERDNLREALKSCQEKQVAASEAKTADKAKK